MIPGLLPVAATALVLLAQLTSQSPSDARSNQFEDPKGTTWRVLALDTHPGGPLAIVEVQEVRQHNPPSTWAVYARNRGLRPIASYTLAAAIVSGDGSIRAVQPLPAIRNLAPGKVARQEIRVRVTVLVPSDRVVFFVDEVVEEEASWKTPAGALATLVQAAVKRLPAP